MESKAWGGRFSQPTHDLVEHFTASILFDRRLYAYDILGSIAHCRMLAKCGIITDAEAARRQALVDAGDGRLDAGDGQAYTPGGGLRQLGLGISLIYPLASRWSLVGLAGMEWLADEAANSPLVRQREQFAGGLGVGYRF